MSRSHPGSARRPHRRRAPAGRGILRSALIALLFVLCATSQVACAAGANARGPAAAQGRGILHVVGSQAEWHRPKDVLVHTPGDEVFLGVVHPAAALFSRPFSLRGAQIEHERLIRALQAEGARVHTLMGALLNGAADEDGRAIHGPALEELRAFAGRFLRYDTSALPPGERAAQERYRAETLRGLGPRELVKIILEQPTVHLNSPAANGVRDSASYALSPAMNMYFMRDPMITTAKGVVIGRMGSPQRWAEAEIAKFALRRLGVTPIYEVQGEGRLEGGDFFPAGDTAFIGQGRRTNAEGVRQLLEARVFGAPRVVVVKDPWKHPDQVHLDTYFNLIASRLAAVSRERIDVRDARGHVVAPANPARRPLVDVYVIEGDRYVKIVEDADFQRYVEGELGYRLLPVATEEQLRYGINFLTVAPMRILGVGGVGAAYKATLAKLGVAASWLDVDNLTSGYGAIHCMTQVLRREPRE